MTKSETWDGTANLYAYAEVEAAENYSNAAEIRAYREERLTRYDPHVRFLRALGVPAAGLRVVDVGSGSSAFLYALDRAALLVHGVGIEISPSRHAFAERWRTDEGFTRVTNLCANFLDVQLDAASVDLFAAIDDTYLYLRPEGEDYPQALLEAAWCALAPGGLFVAAFRNDASLVDHMDGERSFWVELPESNAFHYALYRQTANLASRVMRTESIYITRELSERRKVEITEICDIGELRTRILDCGFAEVDLYGDFAFEAFHPQSSPNVVVVARR